MHRPSKMINDQRPPGTCTALVAVSTRKSRKPLQNRVVWASHVRLDQANSTAASCETLCSSHMPTKTTLASTYKLDRSQQRAIGSVALARTGRSNAASGHPEDITQALQLLAGRSQPGSHSWELGPAGGERAGLKDSVSVTHPTLPRPNSGSPEFFTSAAS